MSRVDNENGLDGCSSLEVPAKKKSKLIEALSLTTQSQRTSDNSSESFARELERWIAHTNMSIEQSSRDVLLWFKLNGFMYPRVSLMAKDYLAIMSTSVPSEQAFSRAGTTVSKRRARLGDDCVSAVCELQSWLKIKL